MENYIPIYGLKYYQDFNQEQINMSLLFAIGNKDWPLVDFLLNSSELPLHGDIYCMSNSPFIFVVSHGDEEMLTYLIFNLNIEKTTEIEKILYNSNSKLSKLADSFFQIRELNQELHSTNQIDKILKL
jgi:hypothetical protein